MRIPDTNVLLFATDSTSERHRAARSWLEQALSGSERVGFPLGALLGFVRIATRSQVMADPLSAAQAFDQVEEWLEQPPAIVVEPGADHLAVCRDLLESAGTAGNLTSDAHLAAIAIERGATFATFDGDFHRFAGLDLEFLG